MTWMDWTGRTSIALALIVTSGCSDDGLSPLATETAAASTGTMATAGQDDGSTGAVGTAVPDGTGSSGLTGPPSDTETATAGSDDSGGTGMPPAEQCEAPEDCMLVNDCCRCEAFPVGVDPPACPEDCLQPTCDALGIPDIAVECVEGQCRLDERNCSDATVTCEAPTPVCPDGTLPEVTRDGSCYTGACIPVEACSSVPGCDVCPDDQVCVVYEAGLGPLYTCAPIPEACGGVPTCACMPPDTCAGAFDVCVDGDGQLQCTCPAC